MTGEAAGTHSAGGIRYLRAIEDPDGGWQCRVGRRGLDEHECLDDALAHLRSAAESVDGSTTVQIVVHAVDMRPEFL